jgi:diadenosine tetraphosphatase ApaH/serine/threonine PP2A family protein phosphatase
MLNPEPFTIVHGTPNDPLWDYLLSYPQADDAWYMSGADALVVGHSHLAFVCEERTGMLMPGPEGLRVAVGAKRLVVNPGSVGQPRDGDPRASYAMYDDALGIVSLQRVDYDIAATQRRMVDAGLPDSLVSRLSLGR